MADIDLFFSVTVDRTIQISEKWAPSETAEFFLMILLLPL